MADIQEAAERGAALLDKERPGWEKRINLELLKMNSCVMCILGQLFHDFNRGAFQLNLGIDPEPAYEDKAAVDYYGFDGFQRRADEWNAAWVAEIKKRRGADEADQGTD